MKTVRVLKDFDFQANPRAIIAFKSGQTYDHVTDAAADAIVAASAGEVVEQQEGRKKKE